MQKQCKYKYKLQMTNNKYNKIYRNLITEKFLQLVNIAIKKIDMKWGSHGSNGVDDE